MLQILEHHLTLNEPCVKMTFYGQIVPYSMSTPSTYYFQRWSSCFYESVISLTKTHWAAPERGDALTPSCNPKLWKEILVSNLFFGSSSFGQKVSIVHCLGTCLITGQGQHWLSQQRQTILWDSWESTAFSKQLLSMSLKEQHFRNSWCFGHWSIPCCLTLPPPGW